jgi:hypothetical protein
MRPQWFRDWVDPTGGPDTRKEPQVPCVLTDRVRPNAGLNNMEESLRHPVGKRLEGPWFGLDTAPKTPKYLVDKRHVFGLGNIMFYCFSAMFWGTHYSTGITLVSNTFENTVEICKLFKNRLDTRISGTVQ